MQMCTARAELGGCFANLGSRPQVVAGFIVSLSSRDRCAAGPSSPFQPVNGFSPHLNGEIPHSPQHRRQGMISPEAAAGEKQLELVASRLHRFPKTHLVSKDDHFAVLREGGIGLAAGVLCDGAALQRS
jgi:hypothetical protein